MPTVLCTFSLEGVKLELVTPPTVIFETASKGQYIYENNNNANETR